MITLYSLMNFLQSLREVSDFPVGNANISITALDRNKVMHLSIAAMVFIHLGDNW